MFTLPNEPQPIGKVIDTAFKLYRSVFKTVLPLAALYALLLQLPSTINSRMSVETVSGGPAIVVGVVSVAAVIVGVGLYIALLHAIDRIAHGQHQPLGYSVAHGFRKLLPTIGAIILITLALMAGFVLLVIPGLILMVTLAFTVPLVVLEDRGVIESIKRSHRLVWGDWWRTLAELTIIGLIYSIPFILVGAVIGGVVGATGSVGAANSMIVDIAMIAISAVLTPLMASGFLAIFYDRRLRKEGADLEARLSSAA